VPKVPDGGGARSSCTPPDDRSMQQHPFLPFSACGCGGLGWWRWPVNTHGEALGACCEGVSPGVEGRPSCSSSDAGGGSAAPLLGGSALGGSCVVWWTPSSFYRSILSHYYQGPTQPGAPNRSNRPWGRSMRLWSSIGRRVGWVWIQPPTGPNRHPPSVTARGGYDPKACMSSSSHRALDRVGRRCPNQTQHNTANQTNASVNPQHNNPHR
jgi:hypothetical protein